MNFPVASVISLTSHRKDCVRVCVYEWHASRTFVVFTRKLKISHTPNLLAVDYNLAVFLALTACLGELKKKKKTPVTSPDLR